MHVAPSSSAAALCSPTTLALFSHRTPRVPYPTRRPVARPLLLVCPLGDINYHVTVKDAASNPVGLDGGARFLAVWLRALREPRPGVIADNAAHTMTATANAAGVASFPLAMGGCCRP